jgi:hypothetical protein
MPAHDRIGRDELQVLTPAGAQSTGEDPQQLVPGPKPSASSASGRPSQHGELMAQEQVLEDEVLARAGQRVHGREQQREQFEHVVSIADSAVRAGFCRPTARRTGSQRTSSSWVSFNIPS